MQKQLLFIALFILLLTGLCAQNRSEEKLRKSQDKLAAMKGPERIEALTDLAKNMMFSAYTLWDSSLYYSQQAIDEARAIGYKQGLCRAHIIHGDALLQFQRAIEAEQYFREAIKLAEQTGHQRLFAEAHRRLGQAFWYQGRFQDAIDKISFTIPLFEKAGNDFFLINSYTSIASIYNDWGNYEKGFEYSQKALTLSRDKGDNDNIIQCCVMIGLLYAGIGDQETALSYYKKALSYLYPCDECYQKRSLDAMRGNLYRTAGNYDSSMFFLMKAYKGNPTSTLTKYFIAETLLGQQRFDTALQVLTSLYDIYKKSGNGARYWQLSAAIGAAYYGKKEYDKALRFTAEGLNLASQRALRGQYILDAFTRMSSIYKSQGQPDSALYYFEQYARMKDSVISDQLKGKLFEFRRIAEDEKKQSQIALLENQARQDKAIRNLLISGIILVVIMGFFILRSVSLKRRNERLKNEQLQSQLQHKATELEMQALRAQMNPHFIFNCLSSINRFILKNETDIASDYLTRFSRLIRLVLIHSRSSLILLKEEIEMLKLYLDMEQLRFKHAFDYTISFSDGIDPETISIPPLLLQPFCENAIWHGLMHKEDGRGDLSVAISKDHNQLVCVITDNGIGRKKAWEIKSRSGDMQQSMGLKITAERLALINKEKRVNTAYAINDLTDSAGSAVGTRVMLSIKYDQLEEVLA